MAMMLGRKVWYGVFCKCCNGPRTVKAEKARERREFARELRPQGLLPTPLDHPALCLHDCGGECEGNLYALDADDYGCRFWCHSEVRVAC